MIVCLGATAAQTLLGKQFRVSRQRGMFIESLLAPFVTATVHPSSILCIPDDAIRASATRQFVDDPKRFAIQLSRNEELRTVR